MLSATDFTLTSQNSRLTMQDQTMTGGTFRAVDTKTEGAYDNQSKNQGSLLKYKKSQNKQMVS